MGYDTNFEGRFDLDKPLDTKTYNLLVGLNQSRRMKRKVGDEFGVEGEFYTTGKGFRGSDDEENIIDSNQPPRTQPSLWLKWIPTKDRLHIEWDKAEKFYGYIEWIEYIVEKILIPKGYVLNGKVSWQGQDPNDKGVVIVKNNEVEIKEN